MISSLMTPKGNLAASALVDPMAYISKWATVGPRAIIEAEAHICGLSLVEAEARVCRKAYIGPRTIIGPGATIGSEVSIGQNCEIHAGARIGPHSWIGSGVTIGPNVSLPERTVLTAGRKIPFEEEGLRARPRIERKDKDHQLHCEDGPALIFSDGTEYWYRHGNLHREDGPAITGLGFEEYWLSGVRVTLGELPDPEAPDTLGYRVWWWDPRSKCLRSPLWSTPWHDPEMTSGLDPGDQVSNREGIHAWRLIRGDWRKVDPKRTLFRLRLFYDRELVPVTGIVERYGKAVVGSLGWRAEWVHIRELLAAPKVAEELRRAYPEVIVHNWIGG